MPHFLIPLSDAKKTRVEDAYCGLYGLQPNQTAEDLVIAKLKETLISTTRDYEKQVKRNAAEATVDELDLDVDV